MINGGRRREWYTHDSSWVFVALLPATSIDLLVEIRVVDVEIIRVYSNQGPSMSLELLLAKAPCCISEYSLTYHISHASSLLA